MLAVVKINSNGQTTIPVDIQAALRVIPGDLIAWEVGRNGTALVRRVPSEEVECAPELETTLSEWLGSADEEAYRDL
ncbi:MAG: type II toxin-antitoxin system PrlF family antitoxin [Magnetococcus sp. YQC-9]